MPTCEALAAAGHEVLAVDKVFRAEPPCRHQIIDLLRGEDVRRAVQGCEAVVHLGNHPGQRSGFAREVFNENVAMNMNVFEACREAGVGAVVFASTIQVLAGSGSVARGVQLAASPAYLPMDGELPDIPANSYALSKAVGERMLRYFVAMGLPSGVAVRFPRLLSDDVMPSARRLEGWSDNDLREGLAYLHYRDGASLIERTLTARPAGYRVYFPAAQASVALAPAQAVIGKHYAHVPLQRPLAQIESLVDTSAITRETGWMPLRNG
jgi:nucleoside-diphosphate-sugar epimerase